MVTASVTTRTSALRSSSTIFDFTHEYQHANPSFRDERLDESGQPKSFYRAVLLNYVTYGVTRPTYTKPFDVIFQRARSEACSDLPDVSTNWLREHLPTSVQIHHVELHHPVLLPRVRLDFRACRVHMPCAGYQEAAGCQSGDSTSDTSQPVQGSTFRVSDREHEAMILVRLKRDDIWESVNCCSANLWRSLGGSWPARECFRR